jgi:copper chaperone NosL
MVDFYRWNYNYGHNLDPNAAIQVPGMAYQPPLIGFKQLLNFGAYSIPDLGGWLLIAAGLLIGLAVARESGVVKKWLTRKNTTLTAALVAGLITFHSCGHTGPRPIELNKDMCAFCRMTITDPKFATQVVTTKGRQYIFDDMVCLIAFGKDNKNLDITGYYVADYMQPQQFILIEKAMILESDSLRSPMGGNYAAFANEDSAMQFSKKFNAKSVTWSKLFE